MVATMSDCCHAEGVFGLMRKVLLFQDEDGAWIAEVPSLPGCHSDGETHDEALMNVQEAIALWIEDAEAHGETLPQSDGQVD